MNKKLFIVAALIIGVSSFSNERDPLQKNTHIQNSLDSKNTNIYKNLRDRWVDFMVGTGSLNNISEKNKEILINNYNRRSSQILTTYNSDLEKKYLWEDISDMTDGNQIKKNFENIIVLSKAYIFPGTEAYKNPEVKEVIIDSLEWLNKNGYYIGAKKNGNWWNWEIGTPKVLNEIIAYMFEELPHELRTNLLKTSYSFQPYAELSGVTIQDGKESYSLKRVSTGGNRLDTAIIVLVRGILSEDEVQILDAVKAVPQVGEFVTTGDGFYTDGSFIQHDNVSYNGTYAAVLFSGLGNILNLTKDTKYQISDPRLENIYKIILEGYDPLLINGRVMDMVNGRSISRDNGSDLEKGRAILNSIAIISENVNEPYQSKLRALVKHNIETNSSYYLPDLVSDPKLKTIYDNIMKDSNIQYSKQDKSKFYLSTDRVVHKRKDYSLGIAMHSYRIANFETMNGENQKGWHTSDGATYLYTSDVEQYKDFWPTVDQYHLPGTTESIAPRKNMSGERRFKNMMSPKSWVGGAGDGVNSMVGMDFISWNGLTTAKKSWFLIGDVVVALGSNINSYDGEVHTTIENRKLNNNNYEIFVDGKELKNKISFSSDKPTRFNLNKNHEKENLGYIVLKGDKIDLSVNTEKGDWKSLGGNSDKEIQKDYFKLFINHGKNPKNGEYAYIILPMKTLEEVDEFDIENLEILNLDSHNHSIRELKNNVLGINFWKNEKNRSEIFTSYNPLSLIAKSKNNILDIWVSNPTQLMKNDNILEIEGQYRLVNTPNTKVNLKTSENKTILEIDLKNKGESVNIQLEKIL